MSCLYGRIQGPNLFARPLQRIKSIRTVLSNMHLHLRTIWFRVMPLARRTGGYARERGAATGDRRNERKKKRERERRTPPLSSHGNKKPRNEKRAQLQQAVRGRQGGVCHAHRCLTPLVGLLELYLYANPPESPPSLQMRESDSVDNFLH